MNKNERIIYKNNSIGIFFFIGVYISIFGIILFVYGDWKVSIYIIDNGSKIFYFWWRGESKGVCEMLSWVRDRVKIYGIDCKVDM